MKKYHYLVWDWRNISHIARHRVTPDEVEQVVFSHSYRLRKGKGGNIYYILGQTDSGRYLFIGLRDLRKNSARVITARDMSDNERKWYKR